MTPGPVAGRVPDALADRVGEPGVGVIGAYPWFLVVQDDPDGQHPGGGGDTDDPAASRRAAAVPGDERGDERPVQVRRLVASRVGAHGVVRPGEDRPGQVGRAGVHAGVQDADGHPLAPAQPPGGRGVDGPELRLLGHPDLGPRPGLRRVSRGGSGPGRSGTGGGPGRGRPDRGGAVPARPRQPGQGRGRQHGLHPDRPGQHDHCRRAQLTTAGRFSGARISRASCPAALNAGASNSPVAAAGRPSA